MTSFDTSPARFAIICALASVVPVTGTAAPAPAGLQFGQPEVRVNEASRVARIPVVRTGSLAGSVSAEVRTSDGTASADLDYVGTDVTITLPPGRAAGVVVVPLLADTINEPTETVNLELTGTNVGPRTTATLKILDNDPAGVVRFAGPAFSAKENGGGGVVGLVRVGGTASEVSVMLTTGDGTATANADYTPVSTRVTFGANEVARTVPIPIADDDLAEGNETVTLEISQPDGGGALGSGTSATLTVVDDEIAVSFSRAAYGVPESRSAAIVTVLRSGPLNQAVSVNLSTTADSTATPGTEYRPLTDMVVSFPVGVAARTIAVPLKDDTLDDGDKTVGLELSDASAPAQLGTIQKTVVTLVDDDAGGTINFAAPVYNVAETAIRAPITIRRTGGVAGGGTVELRTSDGTAEAAMDYREVVTNVTFQAGELVKTVFVPILNDAMVEDTETVSLTLSDAGGGAVIGTSAQAVLRIANEDRGGTISFARSEYSTMESNGTVVVTLSRAGGLAGEVTVELASQGGTASAGTDFAGLPTPISFAAGAATAQVTLLVTSDSELEGTEWTRLHLTNPTGGVGLGSRTNAVLLIREGRPVIRKAVIPSGASIDLSAGVVSYGGGAADFRYEGGYGVGLASPSTLSGLEGYNVNEPGYSHNVFLQFVAEGRYLPGSHSWNNSNFRENMNNSARRIFWVKTREGRYAAVYIAKQSLSQLEIEYNYPYGRFAWSDYELPVPPRLLSVTDTRKGGQLLVEWEKSVSEDVAGYDVLIGTDGVFFNARHVFNVTKHLISGLPNGKLHHVRVLAYDREGNQSQFSEMLTGLPSGGLR